MSWEGQGGYTRSFTKGDIPLNIVFSLIVFDRRKAQRTLLTSTWTMLALATDLLPKSLHLRWGIEVWRISSGRWVRCGRGDTNGAR